MFKDTIQEILNAELTEHLGYEKNEYTEDNILLKVKRVTYNIAQNQSFVQKGVE